MQEYLIAFAVGGTICALSQLLMDKTKLMPGRIMVILVVTGVVLGAFGIYEPFKEWAGAGASVPLLGFGNTLWKGVKKAVDEEGLLGIFKGGLTASSAGICAATVSYTHLDVYKRQILYYPRVSGSGCWNIRL